MFLPVSRQSSKGWWRTLVLSTAQIQFQVVILGRAMTAPPRKGEQTVEKYCDSPDHDRNQLQVQVKPIRAIDRNEQFQGSEPLGTGSL